jgi:hypothetical protein
VANESVIVKVALDVPQIGQDEGFEYLVNSPATDATAQR